MLYHKTQESQYKIHLYKINVSKFNMENNSKADNTHIHGSLPSFYCVIQVVTVFGLSIQQINPEQLNKIG